MFVGAVSECSSLISLSDISIWKLNNAVYLNDLFSNCISLETLPDISKWDIKMLLPSIIYLITALL